MKNCACGFGLIEVLFVLVILAILSAIAIPAYTGYVTRANRAEGRDALMGLLHTQENLRSVCPQYAGTIGPTTDCTSGQVGASTTTAKGYYAVAIVSATETGFTASAAAQGTQKERDAECPQLTLSLTVGNLSLTPPQCWK